jgi:hypothetical protein
LPNSVQEKLRRNDSGPVAATWATSPVALDTVETGVGAVLRSVDIMGDWG